MNINYKLLGKRIKEARLSTKKTQEQCAEQLEVSVGYISQVERGATKISLDTLAQLAVFIGADIAALITGVAFEDAKYLLDEIDFNFTELLPKERQMVYDFITLLKENR